MIDPSSQTQSKLSSLFLACWYKPKQETEKEKIQMPAIVNIDKSMRKLNDIAL